MIPESRDGNNIRLLWTLTLAQLDAHFGLLSEFEAKIRPGSILRGISMCRRPVVTL